MKVKDLIAELQKLDGETRILVKGYEAGFCDIERIEGPVEMAINYYPGREWWNGPHERVIGHTEPDKLAKCSTEPALIIRAIL